MEERNGAWSLGAMVRVQTSPYIGQEELDDFMPLITFSGEDIYIAGSQVGWHAYDTDDWQIDTYAAYRFSGYTPESSEFLDDMERKDSIDSGVEVTRKTDYGRFTLDISTDVSNRHNGEEVAVRYSEVFKNGRWQLIPWLGVNWQSSDLANYYYGVEQDEVTSERNAYEVGDTVNVNYGLDIRYRIDQHSFFSWNIAVEQLSKDIAYSPIVDERTLFKSAFAYRYEFNDFLGEGYSGGGGIIDFLTNDKPWFWRIASGCYSDSSWNKIIRGDINCYEEGTGISSIFLGKQLSDKFFGLPIETWIKAGYAHHDEEDLQDNFGEYVLAFKAYFTKFPWSHKVKTRIGLGEGISYAESIPYFERASVEDKNYSASHYLNYIDYSLDFSLGDLFGVKSMEDCYFGWAIHHRSGIFSSSAIYGNVSGGSNYNTLYLECQQR
jgi:outer membrane protein